MWFVPNLTPGNPFYRPVGVTCEHVFLTSNIHLSTIARVRIDSLGAGLPPD